VKGNDKVLLSICIKELRKPTKTSNKTETPIIRCRKEDNIKTYLKDWINLAQVREKWLALVNTVMDLRDS
jgi:hypothetical protein